MYEAYYGLTGKPFQLNPDPTFYFGSRQHRRAMAYLEYGLHQNEGFIVITGEVGAGKTTLVRNLLSKVDSNEVIAANLVSTQLDAEDTLRMVASSFGIPSKNTEKSDLLLAIEAFLVAAAKNGKRCLLVVDEAQNLTPKAVEELRMLSNFQIETHALLQSFLIGQPEFRQILRSPQMQQLRQRVIASCHIGPMDAEETRGYIEHRLRHVGWEEVPRFQPDAFEAIHKASGGIPRRINSVCDRLLLSGFLAENQNFSRKDVEEVAGEIDDETFGSKSLNDPTVQPGAVGKEGGFSTNIIDLSQNGFDVNDVRTGHVGQQSTYTISGDELLARWTGIEHGFLRFERSMLRIERRLARIEKNNSASMALLDQMLDRLPSSGESKINEKT